MHCAWSIRVLWLAFPLLGACATPRPVEQSRGAALDGEKADRSNARALVELTVPRSTYDLMIDQIVAQMHPAGKPAPPPEVAAKLKAAMLEVIPYDDELRLSSEIYARYYTDQDLAELRAFYQSPVGKKALGVMPQIAGDVMREVLALTRQRLPAALERQGLGKRASPAPVQ